MGFVPPEEVGPQTVLLVDDAAQAAVGKEPGSTPVLFDDGVDVTVPARPVTFTVDDVIAAEGPRVPDAASSPREFHMAFLVLVLSDDAVDDALLDDIDGLRQRFETEWEEDVGGRADLVTALGASTAPEWGAADSDTGADDTAADGDPPADGADGADAGCGCAAQPASSGGLALVIGAIFAAIGRRTPVRAVRSRRA
jgi:hypothetical protein